MYIMLIIEIDTALIVGLLSVSAKIGENHSIFPENQFLVTNHNSFPKNSNFIFPLIDQKRLDTNYILLIQIILRKRT